jgi:predicted metal-binding membrane protein
MWPRAVMTIALRGPGKALLLASASGWIVLTWLLGGDRLPHGVVAMDHGVHAAASSAVQLFHAAGHFTPLWSAMILAMAPPLLRREIGHVWRTSLYRLRQLTLAWFICGYAALWLLAGGVVAILSEWLIASAERIAFAGVLVALWHCSPARQRCLNACHRVPAMRVFGTAAQWDALRYGASTGLYCVAACGPLMLLVWLVQDRHLIAMAAAAIVVTAERHVSARRPRWQLPFVRGRSPEWSELPVRSRIAG